MTDLFTFGTLMDAELLSLVCGRSIDSIVREPANVNHHKPFWVQDDHYPVLVPTQDAVTPGMIIRQLSDEDLARIVFFEGGEFSVETIDVINATGVEEVISFFADNNLKPVSSTPWHLQDWQQSTKQDTLPRVIRYMKCFGKMDVHEADAYW